MRRTGYLVVQRKRGTKNFIPGIGAWQDCRVGEGTGPECYINLQRPSGFAAKRLDRLLSPLVARHYLAMLNAIVNQG